MFDRLYSWFTLSAAARKHWEAKPGCQEFRPALEALEDRNLLNAAVLTEYQQILANPLEKSLYHRLANSAMAADGAVGVNARWEQDQAPRWYIEEQRAGEPLILAGLIHHDAAAIDAGIKMFNWGFAHQAADGSFHGTGDAFHSTALFVEAVAHASLLLGQSPQAEQYADQVTDWIPKLYEATEWMVRPKVWTTGVAHDAPYTHRYYLDADALGLTSLLVGGDAKLMDHAHELLSQGLARQRADGINPERGGNDSSYQAVGLVYAERWAVYFRNDDFTPAVRAMVERGLPWEESRILPSGAINTEGDTRVGKEPARDGRMKRVDRNMVIDAFASWSSITGEPRWQEDGRDVAHV
jgi:hypothetical protein